MKALSQVLAAMFAVAIVCFVVREAQGAWLPTALGGTFTLLVSTAPSFRRVSILCPLAMCLIAFAQLGWLASEPDAHIWHPHILMALGALLFVMGFGWLISTKEGQKILVAAFGLIGIPVVLVSYFSTSTGSAGRMLKFFINDLHLSPEIAEHSILIVRKSIHFTFYGWVALMCCIALKRGKLSLSWATLVGFLMGLSLASFDEYRQSMTSDRTGQWQDVVLDMCGALTFLAIQYVISRKRQVRNKL